jgi:hypothetical protein
MMENGRRQISHGIRVVHRGRLVQIAKFDGRYLHKRQVLSDLETPLVGLDRDNLVWNRTLPPPCATRLSRRARVALGAGRIVCTPRQSLNRAARVLAGDRLNGSFYGMRCDEPDAASLCD